MNKPAPSSRAASVFGLRTVLVVPFVLQIVLAVGLTGYLSLRNGQHAVNDVAGQLRQEVTSRIQDALNTYLGIPKRVNQLHITALLTRTLSLDKPASRELHFGKLLQDFPEVSNTYVGTAKGELFGARESPGKTLQLTLKNAETQGELHYYSVDSEGRKERLEQSVPNYEPRNRPWYQAAVAAESPTWSEIFVDAGSKGLAITAVSPFYSEGHTFRGVVGTALRFTWIEKFLSGLSIGRTGQVFIIERSGFLVATSRRDPLTLPATEGGELKRLQAEYSTNLLVSSTTRYLRQYFGDFSRIEGIEQLNYNLAGDNQFAQVTPLDRGSRSLGLDWLIVAVVPESDFMERIQHNTRITILLSSLALLVALVVGILTSRWIAAPLLRLNVAAKELAAGNWSQQSADSARSDEVGQLAASFYSMAGQLREMFEHLEEKVRERTLDLARKNQELSDLNDQLVKLNQDKNEFLGIAAHDLKNPLSAIKGLAEEIQEAYDEMEREEVIEYAGKIHTASQKMFALITNLLDVNAIESGKMNVSISEVDLLPVISGVAVHYARQAQVKGIVLDFIHAEEQYMAYVDESTAHQILDNLVSNAVKYSPPGKRICVRILYGDNKIRCEVEDQGPGLDEEDRKKLFGKFNRLSAKPTGGEHSTGLGLFIVKKLVEAMHGEVWCESEPGKGAIFVVEFPSVAGGRVT